eukprot:TRINITY_DN1162_c0_g2_i2.p1 TRINITY_DN1162_c0_g2~~TRINITY_DN1162_c0_g2_i2.p1  ORF type:complete len:117 (-),score=16.53 TRINITY_DN1162_c0_g2_i2:377-727(-)
MHYNFSSRCVYLGFFFLMIRRPPRSTQSRSSAASDVYKRQTSTFVITCYICFIRAKRLRLPVFKPRVVVVHYISLPGRRIGGALTVPISPVPTDGTLLLYWMFGWLVSVLGVHLHC